MCNNILQKYVTNYRNFNKFLLNNILLKIENMILYKILLSLKTRAILKQSSHN